MQITGDSNATLKDLTTIVEAEIADVRETLYPRISSDIDSANEAYIKIPIQTKVEFPVQFEGEREQTSTEVNIVQQYNKATYALTMDYDSDLMRESKAYSFSEKTQEGTISAKIFPSYNLTTNIVVSNINAYDGNPFYNATHLWANAGSNNINNTVAKTGQTQVALQNDLASAVKLLRTFLDDKGRILNPFAGYGKDALLIHCPAALELAFRQLLFGTIMPITVPVTTSGTAAAPASGMNTLDLRGVADLFVDPYLDAHSATTWYLHYIGMPQRPFVFTQSYDIIAKALGFGSEFETNTNKVRIALKHRFVEGVYRFDRSIRVA